MRSSLAACFFFVVGSWLAACASSSALKEIRADQKKILAKLDSLASTLAQRPLGPDPSKVHAAPVADSPVRGPNDAWVTIVEWTDFQCPFCSRVVDTLQQVQRNYGTDVRVVVKMNPLPFHVRALAAANAAECAHEQGKFWAVHDALFKNQ